MMVRTHLNFCFNMINNPRYEKIEKSIEVLFLNKLSFKHKNISIIKPSNYIYKIKNYCKSRFHFIPLVEDIDYVFKDMDWHRNNSIKRINITFDYDFTNNINEDYIGKIKNILQQNKYHTYETHPNVFLLAKHEKYKKNILIFVSNQKYKKQLEIRFEDLQNILKIFKWFCEHDYGQSLLKGSLTECGWSSKNPPEIRHNALKRRTIIKNSDRTIRGLQWCEKMTNMDSSKIKKDLVWVKQNERNFIELKKLILFNAKEIVSNEDLFSKSTEYSITGEKQEEDLIDLVFVLNISKN